MVALRLVELQRRGKSVQHALGGAGEVAALHADVVVDRHPGEHRDLFAPQTLDPAVAAVRREARLLGRDPRTPRAQELADLAAQVDRGHASTVGTPCCTVGRYCRYPADRHSQAPSARPSVDDMSIPTFTLNNGVEIPALGFGVFQTPPEETIAAVETALATGYRHIDTAAAYGNEREVGEAIRRSGLDRDEVFVETKVWITDYGYDADAARLRQEPPASSASSRSTC